MKTVIGIVLVVAMLAVAGCGMPAGVKNCLYSSQLSLQATVTQAEAQGIYPFRPDPGETAEAKVSRLEKANALILAVMGQAAKNLTQVVNWASGNTEDLKND